MRACIIANSPVFERELALERARASQLVIVADGAVASLPVELAPHVVCGDMDSHDPKGYSERFPGAEWIHRPCQESNDLEKSIRIAIERGATGIDLVCAFGGRPDKTLMTLSVMELFREEIPVRLFHDGWELQMCGARQSSPGTLSLDLPPNSLLSLVTRGTEATVSLNNVRWPLESEVLTVGSRGLSNRALGGVVALTVHKGCVAVCWRAREIGATTA